MLKPRRAARGALYQYFPTSKDELVLAALGSARDKASKALTGQRGKAATEVAYIDM